MRIHPNCFTQQENWIKGAFCVICHSALQRLRGWNDVDAEMTEMRLEDQSERAEGHLTVLSLLSQRSLRWQLVSVIIMNMGQQLSGVNAVRQTNTPVLVYLSLITHLLPYRNVFCNSGFLPPQCISPSDLLLCRQHLCLCRSQRE